MKLSWETVVNEYLEGKTSRADVELLRSRLELDPDARDEIEAVLRMSDEFAIARRELPPVPANAAERLAFRLQEEFSSNDGAIDEAVARRIARQLRGEPPARPITPNFRDVLAATVDHQKPLEPNNHAPLDWAPGEEHQV